MEAGSFVAAGFGPSARAAASVSRDGCIIKSPLRPCYGQTNNSPPAAACLFPTAGNYSRINVLRKIDGYVVRLN